MEFWSNGCILGARDICWLCKESCIDLTFDIKFQCVEIAASLDRRIAFALHVFAIGRDVCRSTTQAALGYAQAAFIDAPHPLDSSQE